MVEAVKLCDFGFSCICGDEKLKSYCGTPAYLAPEVATPADAHRGYYGRPVDMWALGVIAFCNVPEEEVWAGMSEGVAAIEREFERLGTDDDRKCLRYVLQRGCVMAVGTGDDPDTVEDYTEETLGISSFQLTADEVQALSAI